MDLGMVRKVDIDQEMQQSYLDYAMSVIVARALPDARDGLKPVQRRVLYAMYDMGLNPSSAHKKSARIVGEVLGKYHPHGDMAIYESMARLAQDFTMRHGLVDGQGNFGSVDGDPPAAMRYTEARLSPFAIQLLDQIDRNTVNFSSTFDGSQTEPDVLPAAAPNLLVNGSSGIAVGMATNIPPHNLGEVIDALAFMLREWERMDDIPVSELMKFIKGPDFPTGGMILQEGGQNELLSAYATGRGRVTVRGKVQMEEMARGRSRILITELPYQVNKSSLIERIAELARAGRLSGIADLRDESDRQGMRIVIELSKAAEEENTLRDLYKHTPLESTVGINLLALVDGEPRLLTLKQALRVYLEHRLVVIRRRGEYDLAKAKQRAHILEGLRIALQNLDEIITLIRNSPDVETARTRLMKRFKLSDVQTQAILDMPLRRLAALERKKIEQEYKDLAALIKELESLLRSPRKMRQSAEEELIALKEKFADRRRTQIVSLEEGKTVVEVLTTHNLAPVQDVWVSIGEDGLMMRTLGDHPPRISGRTAPRVLICTNSHHILYLVGEDGQAATAMVETVPDQEKSAEGIPVWRLTPFGEGERVAGAFSVPPRNQVEGERYIMTVSRLGMIKKSAIEDLPGSSADRFVLSRVNPGDSLIGAFITDGKSEVLMLTLQGMAIRFHESEVRPMGLVAAGVNGIKLSPADHVVGVELIQKGEEVMVLSSNGRALRLTAEEFPVQGRYGQGVGTCRLDPGARMVGLMVGKKTLTGTVFFRKAAAQSIRLDAVEMGKRLRLGQVAVSVKPGDTIEALVCPVDSLATWEGKKGRTLKREIREKKEEIYQEELFILPGKQKPPEVEVNDLKAPRVKRLVKGKTADNQPAKKVKSSAKARTRSKAEVKGKESVKPKKVRKARTPAKTKTTEVKRVKKAIKKDGARGEKKATRSSARKKTASET